MRLALFLLLCACGAAQEPAEILGRIRHNVAAQSSAGPSPPVGLSAT